jgi:hypothetical protein
LCHQLQDKPDMDGNQENIKDHKKMLIAWTSKLVLELR